jgi:SAM-dependent methyltransferase
MTFEDRYLSGKHLWGDDFSFDELEAWYADEAQAYHDMTYQDGVQTNYECFALNEFHGLRRLPSRLFNSALGLGSASGIEFQPLSSRIKHLTVVDPAPPEPPDLTQLPPAVEYRSPRVDGTLPFSDQSFDLAFSLGALHHIPNVSHVISEIGRVMCPGGWFLVREPIVSMGDWRETRPDHLTPRERGIPLLYLERALHLANFETVQRRWCMFPLTSAIARVARREPFNSAAMVRIDAALARLSSRNYRYHASTSFQKIRPTSAFLVARRV